MYGEWQFPLLKVAMNVAVIYQIAKKSSGFFWRKPSELQKCGKPRCSGQRIRAHSAFSANCC